MLENFCWTQKKTLEKNADLNKAHCTWMCCKIKKAIKAAYRQRI
jgi:hypothetical protein